MKREPVGNPSRHFQTWTWKRVQFTYVRTCMPDIRTYVRTYIRHAVSSQRRVFNFLLGISCVRYYLVLFVPSLYFNHFYPSLNFHIARHPDLFLKHTYTCIVANPSIHWTAVKPVKLFSSRGVRTEFILLFPFPVLPLRKSLPFLLSVTLPPFTHAK